MSPLGDLGPMGVMPRTRTLPRRRDLLQRHVRVRREPRVRARSTTRRTFCDLRGTRHEHRHQGRRRRARGRRAPGRHSGRPRGRPRAPRARLEGDEQEPLFSALKLEKIATFIILSLAIVVASFCIICTLLLMVTEKSKEIAILKALGASDGAILRIFMSEGHDHRRHRHRLRRAHGLWRAARACSGSAFASIPRSITSIGCRST